MKTSKAVVWLSWLIAVLAVAAVGTGLFWQGEGASFSFQTLHNQTVQINGRGLYQYDTVTTVAQIKGGDVVTLLLGIPLLLFANILYRRGSLRGGLLLTGTLGYFLYTYASLALYAAYNNLFLLYVVLFSASLFAFILAFSSIDREALPGHFSPRLPVRGIATFMFVTGTFLLVAWLGLILRPLLAGSVPVQLESTTTLVIQVLDLGIIAPAAFLSGILLLRRAPLGYLLTSILLMKMLTMGTAVSAMVVGQLLAGIPLSVAEIVPFPLLTLIGIWTTFVLLRHLRDGAYGHMAHA